MAVPPYTQFIEPVLRFLSTCAGPIARRELVDAVVAGMHLSPEDLAEMAGNTKYTKAYHRGAWALSYASMAGLAESPKRGFWQLSTAGRALLAAHPTGLPEAEIQKIIRAGKRTGEAGSEEASAGAAMESTASEATPLERIRQAHAELRQGLRAELLGIVRAMAPAKFERLVLDVLHAMGYGQSRDKLQTTAAGADGGIDGVISLDRLGLEKVYIQAKRYAEDHPISRPTIQAFLGALAERRATKGVFITTSRFSREARECATRSSDSLVLIDGEELAGLMVDYEVGVTVREVLKLASVDGDYFEDE